MLRGLGVVIAVVSCGVDEPAPRTLQPPPCAAAIGEYYAAGCAYSLDAMTVPHDVMAGMCVAMTAIRAECRRQIDAWLSCSALAAAPVCGCDATLEALMWCR